MKHTSRTVYTGQNVVTTVRYPNLSGVLVYVICTSTPASTDVQVRPVIEQGSMLPPLLEVLGLDMTDGSGQLTTTEVTYLTEYAKFKNQLIEDTNRLRAQFALKQRIAMNLID